MRQEQLAAWQQPVPTCSTIAMPCAARIRRQNPGFACLVCSAPDLFFSTFFFLITKTEKKAICRFCGFFFLLLFSFFFFFLPFFFFLHTTCMLPLWMAFSSTTTHQTCISPPACCMSTAYMNGAEQTQYITQWNLLSRLGSQPDVNFPGHPGVKA